MPDVVLSTEAKEQAEELPKVILARVIKMVERLANWPDVSGVRPLGGDLAGWFRLRTGDYRLRFRLKGGKIIVDKIGHRRDFYDD